LSNSCDVDKRDVTIKNTAGDCSKICR